MIEIKTVDGWTEIDIDSIPSPADFSDGQWSVIGMHMRVRANLTATEAEKIIEFLKSAN